MPPAAPQTLTAPGGRAGVPAHDTRDWQFAHEHSLPVTVRAGIAIPSLPLTCLVQFVLGEPQPEPYTAAEVRTRGRGPHHNHGCVLLLYAWTA